MFDSNDSLERDPTNIIFAILSNRYIRFRDVAQPGSARRSGRRGRWFESSHPDHIAKALSIKTGLFMSHYVYILQSL